MPNILTQQEAINSIRIVQSSDCPELQTLMDAADDTIKSATGHDWSADETIDPSAKMAARLLIIHLFFGSPLLDSYGMYIGQLDGKVANGEVSQDTVYGGRQYGEKHI